VYRLRTVKSTIARALAASVIGAGGLTVGGAALMLAGTGPAAASEVGTAATGTSADPQSTGTQMYSCAMQSGTANGGTPVTSALPMRLAASGPDTVAANNAVSLTSATLGKPMAGATPVAASASLGLAGASGGSIPLSAGMHNDQLVLTGNWQPARAGVYHLTAPRRFQVTMRTTAKDTVVMVCTAASVTMATTTAHISAAAMPGATTAGLSASETPTGAANAPATGAGGSLHSPVDLALLMAGVVAVTAGVATMLLAIRRRGRVLTS
jgi:hypothetical protein